MEPHFQPSRACCCIDDLPAVVRNSRGAGSTRSVRDPLHSPRTCAAFASKGIAQIFSLSTRLANANGPPATAEGFVSIALPASQTSRCTADLLALRRNRELPQIRAIAEGCRKQHAVVQPPRGRNHVSSRRLVQPGRPKRGRCSRLHVGTPVQRREPPISGIQCSFTNSPEQQRLAVRRPDRIPDCDEIRRNLAGRPAGPIGLTSTTKIFEVPGTAGSPPMFPTQ